jgi:hypothetical protein
MISHARSLRSLEAAEVTEEKPQRWSKFFFDFPVRGRKIKTVSHFVAR